ncbi:Predicted metal-dependent hydrolase, TIM-barrel fold [Celeribacter baekdonensis]|uniref:Predicted metal-dependent hydrolase, TIM-barrel fold n=1 Tax=Celeribacter baekdonensis TaxID=875171 RepID=A0A1G7UMA4_9RHOB|nr:amidohydrolase family protein [Celeribacter baekdonensis]SDG48229.1 Predicted metal-dependent hydrolase, TIM-barrel fold [Celeribacter baekdonensis]
MHEICDCHLHSFSKSDSPPAGAYVPPPLDIVDYAAKALPLGIVRAVVVQASVDGTDNSRLVDALATEAPLQLRGVATIDPETADLPALHAAGVRAIRIQDRARLGDSALQHLPEMARSAASIGWHLEINTEPRSFAAIAGLMPTLPEGMVLILDHIGHVDPLDAATQQPLFRLMDSGRVWVKLSPTRVSKRVGTYEDLAELVSRIGQDYPNQCIWGSDWPHVMTSTPLPEIPPMLDLCRAALSSEQFHRCMWLNPERLYGF